MQKRIRHLFLALCILLIPLFPGLSIPAEVSLPSDVLTRQEIKQLVEGKTAEVTLSKNDGKGLFFFNPNGELKQLVNTWLAKGRWQVRKNDRLCMLITGGKDWDCRALIRDKEGIGQFVVHKEGTYQRELTYRNFTDGDKLLELAQLSLPPLEKLNKNEIIELFANKTVESETVHKGRVSMTYYSPDGTLELTRNGKVYTGLWRVTDNDRMCLSLEDSKEKCRIIVKQGDIYSKYIVKNNGKHQKSIRYRRFMPGKRF